MTNNNIHTFHSSQFNGADSSFTDTARRIVDRCRVALDEHDNELTQLENDIAAAKKAAEAEAVADIDDPTNDIVSYIDDLTNDTVSVR